jgi:hypothetical protein
MTQRAREQGRGVGGRSARVASWLAWSLWMLTLAAIGAGVVLQLLNASTPTVDPRGPAPLGIGFVLLFMAFSTVGALISSRQPGNSIGWIFCILGILGSFGTASEEYALYALVTRPGYLPGGEIMVWLAAWFVGPTMFAMVAFVLLLFPDGRLLSRRWRPIVWVNLVAILLLLAWTFAPGQIENLGLLKVANPFGVTGAYALLDTLGTIGLFLVLAAAIAGAISLVVRFRQSMGDERQQIKWFVFAGGIFCAVFALAPILWTVPLPSSTQWIWQTLFLLSFGTIPVATGIAILKYRLYEIDLLINRTLVYGALTAILAVVYLGGVAATQAIFRTLTGQEQQPQLAVVVSTLVIAALFTPLRRGIQSFIDRRFYRSKYDAAKTLDAFSIKLRDETNLDALSVDLVGVVRETMHPTHVSLWLRPDTLPKVEKTD